MVFYCIFLFLLFQPTRYDTIEVSTRTLIFKGNNQNLHVYGHSQGQKIYYCLSLVIF